MRYYLYIYSGMALMSRLICLFSILCGIWSCVIVMPGCTNSEERILQEIEIMKKHVIQIPYGEMHAYRGKEIMENRISGKKIRLIKYSDSTECSTCMLKRMYDWEIVMDSLQHNDHIIDILFIFSPPKDKINAFEENLIKNQYPFPIYMDTCNAFLRANPHIPANPIMHSFLLDENDSVILVGNPVRNKKIEELFFKILEEKKNEVE